MKLGYCCNVHGGTTLDEVKRNLGKFTSEVKRIVSPDEPMPIGLWLSQSAIRGLGVSTSTQIDATNEFGDWLCEHGFDPFTFNGFPLGDFHQSVVKHNVYLPTWAESERLDYTIKLARIQAELLSRSDRSSTFQTISTLPLGWPPVSRELLFSNGVDFLTACARYLKQLAKALSQHHLESGIRTMVCIEPEPGCVFDNCDDIVRFFNRYLLDDEDSDIVRNHIGVCHDICHSAVMFEDQATAVQSYTNAGIQIGKVQVSSALRVCFGSDAESDRLKLDTLSRFSEPKYLHQTSIQFPDGSTRFYEDLDIAIRENPTPNGEWRVHFHVPIFASRLSHVGTTQDAILEFLDALKVNDATIDHFEVETYAWTVLPDEHRDVSDNLASGIAAEINWFAALTQSQ